MGALEFIFLGRIPVPDSKGLHRKVEDLEKKVAEKEAQRKEAERTTRELTLKLLEKQRTKRPPHEVPLPFQPPSKKEPPSYLRPPPQTSQPAQIPPKPGQVPRPPVQIIPKPPAEITPTRPTKPLEVLPPTLPIPPPPKRGSPFEGASPFAAVAAEPTSYTRKPLIRVEVEPTLKDRTQSKVVLMASWLMVVIMILSFGGIIALTILKCDVPDILTVGASSPLGYFGGMLSAYFGIQQKT